MHSVVFWFINGGHYACVFVVSKWHKHGCYFSKTRPLCCVLVVSISIFFSLLFLIPRGLVFCYCCFRFLIFDSYFSIFFFCVFCRFAFVCALVFVSTSVCFCPCVRLWFIPIFILIFSLCFRF